MRFAHTIFALITLLSIGCSSGSDDLIFYGENNEPPVKHMIFNEDAFCSTDTYPYFSCLYDESFPNDQAESINQEVEFSFASVDRKAKLISPADRVLFNLLVYRDPLYTTFRTTSITRAQFDTIKTDYLVRNMSAGKYYIDISTGMSCIFFQCVNGKYGLIRINSVIGNGLEESSYAVNFDVKYAEQN